METSGISFIKYLLFIFNLFFTISGIGLIVAGAVVLNQVSKIKFFIFLDSGLTELSIVHIVTGAIVFVIAFLGCIGAIKESYKMLMAFAALLIVIFIVEFVVGVTAVIYKSDLEDELNEKLTKSLAIYEKDSKSKHTLAAKFSWDVVQDKLKCCGVDGPSDWKIPPHSCCSSFLIPIEKCMNDDSGKYRHQSGCYKKLAMKINSNLKILIGVGVGIAVVEIVGVFLACWLAHTIKKEVSE